MAGLGATIEGNLIRSIDNISKFRDFGIAYLGRDICKVLRNPRLPEGYQAWIVLKEEEAISSGSAVPQATSSGTNIVSELIDMGLSCGSAVLAGTAATASTGAAPLTVGASVAFTYLATAAAIASAAQCGYSTGRVFNAIFTPDSNTLLDNSEWVQRTTQVLDAISLAGGVASLGQGARAVLRLSRSSGKPIREVIRGLNRAGRKQLAQDLAAYAGKAATRKQFLRLAKAGKVTKVFTRNQISSALASHLLDAIGTVLTTAGSFRSGLGNKVVRIYFVD